MPPEREIRADYDANTITIYQAYSAAIAAPALVAQRFVPPFSFGRIIGSSKEAHRGALNL